MDTNQTKDLLLELYAKISGDQNVDETSEPFVKILLEQITTCISDQSEANMSTLMDLLHSYSLINIEASKTEEAIALQSSLLGDSALTALEDLGKVAENLNGTDSNEEIAQQPETPQVPVEPIAQAIDPTVAPAPTTFLTPSEPTPQATQSKEEDAKRIEQIMAQLKTLNGTQAN